MKGASTDALDIRVDLRSAWSAVRDQGSRSSCLACAASDAHAHSHERRQPLSAEFLFFHAGQLMPRKSVTAGLTFSAVDRALQTQGQPDEMEWPYAGTQPSPWTPPVVSQRWYGSLASSATDIQSIIKSIETQQPVILGVRLTAEFLALTAAPYIISAAGKGVGGHAVLAIGLADHPAHGSLIMMRNSWGPKWGENGCAWLCTDYLTDKMIGYRVASPMSTPK
jgi:C1A family cysteine protease